MRSREFFGSWKFKDIHIECFNKIGEKVYESHTTTFANVNPILQEEIDYAINEYWTSEEYPFNGEIAKVEVYTTPNCKCCVYNTETKKKTFPNNF